MRTSVSAARKQELLDKAHALYEQHQQHSRGMRAQVQELREQLVRVHQQAQQAALGQLLPTAPAFAADADVSPLTAAMADSSDPALLALLDNSKTLESKLCEKQTLVEQMRLVVERVESFVREQLDKETRRAEAERVKNELQPSASTSSLRRSSRRAWADADDDGGSSVASVALPDLASTLTSPLVSSLTAHISALQQQNSLTQTLLLLKNKSLAQQQEQHAMLVETLRAQISGLALRSERREKENLEERAMLTEGLKTIIDTLATENEQLKKAAAAAAASAMPMPPQQHSPNGFGSHSSGMPNGAPAAAQPNGLPARFPTPPQLGNAAPGAAIGTANLPALPRAANGANGPVPPAHFAPMAMPSFPVPPTAASGTFPAGSFSTAGAMPFSPSRGGLQQQQQQVPGAFNHSPSLRPGGGPFSTAPPPAMPFASPSATPGARPPAGLDAATHALLSSPPFQSRPSFLPPLNTSA